jgi:cellulose synthase/poly-beta-1,6-N-acetylglucosamine synthase-like glycosyltransferase
VVADGASEIRPAVVRQAAAAWRDISIRIVDNPARTIPTALNRAIGAARGDVLVRLDAHSIPAEDYVRRCVESLKTTGAANVGGVWEIQPRGRGWIPRAIAAAAGHPLGAGDARYRIHGRAGPVDTVPFGAFQRDWLRRVGPFDENLLANEDYEFNYRLRQAGGVVWFDPSIRSAYYARGSLAELWRQYARYGYWKARMLLLHPRSLRWRQALPHCLSWSPSWALPPLWWSPARLLLGMGWGALCLVLLAAAYQAARTRRLLMLVGLPARGQRCTSWRSAFWWGLLESVGGRHAMASGQDRTAAHRSRDCRTLDSRKRCPRSRSQGALGAPTLAEARPHADNGAG